MPEPFSDESIVAALECIGPSGELMMPDGFPGRHEFSDKPGLKAHPVIRALVESNNGRCHREIHVKLADTLTPANVLCFREAILGDRRGDIASALSTEPELVDCEFVAGVNIGRGISQPVHHFSSREAGTILLEADADTHALTTCLDSPLSLQLRLGRIDLAEFLLERKADPNIGPCGMMPSGILDEGTKLLLKYGWNIRNAPLLHDARHGHGKRILVWLGCGVDPNMTNANGSTALHLFAQKGTGLGAICALIQAGADPRVQDNAGNTPLSLARDSGNTAIIDALS